MFEKKTMAALARKSIAETKENPAHNTLIILDDVRSMHNVGSAFRTADSFGISGIYLCGYTPAPPHRDIHKTALGAEDSIAWAHFFSIVEGLKAAREAGYKLIAVEQAFGSTALNQTQFLQNEKLAFVFGNEVEGVSDAALAMVDACVEIPQYGAKHSFNISVSIGVVLWEVLRKRDVLNSAK